MTFRNDLVCSYPKSVILSVEVADTRSGFCPVLNNKCWDQTTVNFPFNFLQIRYNYKMCSVDPIIITSPLEL